MSFHWPGTILAHSDLVWAIGIIGGDLLRTVHLTDPRTSHQATLCGLLIDQTDSIAPRTAWALLPDINAVDCPLCLAFFRRNTSIAAP